MQLNKTDNSYLFINAININKNQVVLWHISDPFSKGILGDQVKVLDYPLSLLGDNLEAAIYNKIAEILGTDYTIGDARNWVFTENTIRVYFPAKLLNKCANAFLPTNPYYNLGQLIEYVKNNIDTNYIKGIIDGSGSIIYLKFLLPEHKALIESFANEGAIIETL